MNKQFRVGYYLNMGREETYDYYDTEDEAYEVFINKRSEGETWYDKLVGEEYETQETYYDEED
jgi:hypothetical protein